MVSRLEWTGGQPQWVGESVGLRLRIDDGEAEFGLGGERPVYGSNAPEFTYRPAKAQHFDFKPKLVARRHRPAELGI